MWSAKVSENKKPSNTIFFVKSNFSEVLNGRKKNPKVEKQVKTFHARKSRERESLHLIRIPKLHGFKSTGWAQSSQLSLRKSTLQKDASKKVFVIQTTSQGNRVECLSWQLTGSTPLQHKAGLGMSTWWKLPNPYFWNKTEGRRHESMKFFHSKIKAYKNQVEGMKRHITGSTLRADKMNVEISTTWLQSHL